MGAGGRCGACLVGSALESVRDVLRSTLSFWWQQEVRLTSRDIVMQASNVLEPQACLRNALWRQAVLHLHR